MQPPTVSRPTFEHHHNGFGLEHTRPRISWKFKASPDTAPAWVQTAYELEITFATIRSSTTYHCKSEKSLLVPWPTRALNSREGVCIRVRCWGKSTQPQHGFDEQVTEWSPSAYAEVGLLSREDWTADFITSETRIGPEEPLQPLRFRKQFSLPSGLGLLQARLYITSLGVYQPYINGQLASEELMAPGWTSYHHRLNYRVLDVSKLINQDSPNVIAIEAAEGWYAGRLGVRGGSSFWYGGHDIAVAAQLEVVSSHGHDIWRLESDQSWHCGPSAIQTSQIYDGELFDDNNESPGWNTVEFDIQDNSYGKARCIPWPKARLVSPDAPPVRVVEKVCPVSLIQTPSGKTVIDFGQNLVGKVWIKSIRLPPHQKLTIRHAEVLENGELGTRPLRTAKCKDSVISSGREIVGWTPKFTFHGFRYIEIEGWSGDVELRDFAALVMQSDMRRRGYFSCSNQMVNKLHHNVVWSIKGNFLSVPTDCPQRDERLGWTADEQVICPTASFLYDTIGFLSNWLEDLAAEQLQEGNNGIPPLVCPDTLNRAWPNLPQAVWDDAVVLTPKALFQASGDSAVLSRQYASMKAWLDQGVNRGPDALWNTDNWQFGDWLDPGAPPDNPGDARTDDILVADAYLVHTTRTMSQVSETLGYTEDAKRYSAQAADLRRKFQDKYISPVGNLMSNTQTGVALALQYELYRNSSEIEVAAKSLNKLVRRSKFRIGTGFVGTPLIAHVLTNCGEPQLAYRMLLEKRCPSWMYPVTMGATTIWERWNSMLEDGSINPGQMTSFNHYALGAIADWLHTTVGGISPLEPGWRIIKVYPVPGGNITSADVSFDGPFGLIKCSWKLSGDTNEIFTLAITVPPNSFAQVTLPTSTSGLPTQPHDSSHIQLVGSGSHSFSCQFKQDEWPPKALLSGNAIPQKEEIAE